jgi:CRISPR-associated protein Cas5d
MNGEYRPLEVLVWGDYACFTRPEAKVERVTYPVPTPSAARGILEAIFWKPEFRWRVQEIWVLKPVRYISFVRNELNSRQSEAAAKQWMKKGGGYSTADDRAPRHTLALRDVAYVIRADVQLRPGLAEDPAKYRDQFRRRVEEGRCFQRPYFGCREFAADFAKPAGTEQPIDLNDELGSMLYDLEYAAGRSGKALPIFFDAKIEGGILHVPPRQQLRLYSPSGGPDAAATPG